jgi:hypothetical protein
MIASLSSGTRPHDLSDFLQVVAVVVLGPAIIYALGGRLLAAQSPGGKLSWTGRRWRNGFTLAGAAMAAVLLIYVIGESAPLAVTVPLWALLGYGVILASRWLWRDWEKGKAAQEGLIEKLHQGGRKLVAPPMSAGKKFWRWVLNGYAIALLLALVYGLVRYLVGSH